MQREWGGGLGEGGLERENAGGHGLAKRGADGVEARPPTRFSWRILLAVAGPGLVAMLADTDAGSVITIAQSGARWGFGLLLSNLLFIPFMFIAQELALRIGMGTRQGALELARRHFGRGPALALLAVLAASCFGALVSELSGLAGVGQAIGLPIGPTMAIAVGGLVAMVATGSYRSVERVALFFGLFEAAFLVMAWRASPGFAPIVAALAAPPPRDPDFFYLLAANLGTSVIPWALLYQQTATVEKGLGPAHLPAARFETLIAVIVCQAITSALLIAAGATLASRGAIVSVVDIESAFTATLGLAFGRVVFVLGLTGSALTATIVVCLVLAWSVGEALGTSRSLDQSPKQAPWFYGAIALMLAAGGALVVSGADLVRLTIAAGVANALLLPAVLGFLYFLARTALPAPLRLRGVYAGVTGLAFLIVAGVGVGAAIVGWM